MRRLPLALVAVPALAACGSVIAQPELLRERMHPAGFDRRAPVTTLAVAPLRAGGPLAREASPEDAATAATRIARHLAEAFAAEGLTVVPPEDVRRALERAGAGASDPARLAAVAHAQFGADAVAVGVATRLREREGESYGARRPAAVGFELTVHAAPDGAALWSAVFDETQHALSENVLKARHYPGGGSRWLTADELARWGAGLVAGAFPLRSDAAP